MWSIQFHQDTAHKGITDGWRVGAGMRLYLADSISREPVNSKAVLRMGVHPLGSVEQMLAVRDVKTVMSRKLGLEVTKGGTQDEYLRMQIISE